MSIGITPVEPSFEDEIGPGEIPEEFAKEEA